jgi:putative transposase
VWSALGLKPHREGTLKLSTDPFLIEKLREIVGLYLNPPQNALALCVQGKSQSQALERTQPLLPMGLGYLEGSRMTGSAPGPQRRSQRWTPPTAEY